MTADSVSPLAALDVSAARELLDKLGKQATARAADYQYQASKSGWYGWPAEQRRELANAELLRQVSAALASLPALLADGARLDWLTKLGCVELTLNKTGQRPEFWAIYQDYEMGQGDTLREAVDAARAVRPAGAAPEK